MDCSTRGFHVLHCLPEFAQTHVHWVDDVIQPSHPLSPPSPPTLNLSQHQGLFQMSQLFTFRLLKYWSFSFSISSSNEHSGLISFKIDCFHLLAVQGNFKSLLQHHSLKASILCFLVFFMVQLSHLYITGKTIALTRWTFIGKVLFNMLSRFVIAFLPRRKHLLISWLQSLSTVILEPKKIKSVTVSIFSPIYLLWSDGAGCMILVFWMLNFKPAFSLSLYTFIRRFFCSSSLYAIRLSSTYLGLLIFLWQSWFQLVLHPAWHFAWRNLHRSSICK